MDSLFFEKSIPTVSAVQNKRSDQVDSVLYGDQGIKNNEPTSKLNFVGQRMHFLTRRYVM